MKKILFSLMFALAAMNIMAADVLKVAPFTAEIGTDNDDYEFYFTITLDNEQADYYTGFQFNITLPEGLEVKDGKGGFEFNSDRFVGTTKKGVFTPQHGVKVFAKQADGSYLVAVADEDLSKIKGTSGDLLYVYYTTTADFKGGPISIKKQLFFPNGDTTIKGDEFEGTVVTAVKAANADEASEKANKFMTKKGLVITKGNKKYNAAAQEIK